MNRDLVPPVVGRCLRAWPALLLTLLAGCANSGPIARRGGMLGALKTSVAQLESEKAGLARQLADQKAENRRVESQLAEVESQNGDLAARLDDARAVMSRQGIGEDRSVSSRQNIEDDLSSPRRSTPARVQPKGRRSPFAELPRERRLLDEADDADNLRDPRYGSDGRYDQSRLDDRSPWLPVARGDRSAVLSR